MKNCLLLLLSLTLTVSGFSETLRLSVPGMVCQVCVQGMRKVFKNDVDGKAEAKIIVDISKNNVFLNDLKKDALNVKTALQKVPDTGYNAQVTKLGLQVGLNLAQKKISDIEVKKRLEAHPEIQFVKSERIKAGKKKVNFLELKLSKELDWSLLVPQLLTIFPEIKI